MDHSRQAVRFESGEARCAGWLYRPARGTDLPVVVVAHGFGGERGWRLPAFAHRFVDRGFAVLVFDYRGFGGSGGEPRQVVDPTSQLEDWASALAYVRTLDGVDADRVALWGTSLSAGHVVVTASRDGDVAAVVAQIPFLDGRRTAIQLIRAGGPGYAIRASVAGFRDLFRRLTRRQPHYVPLVGDPDEFAVLPVPDAKAGLKSIVPLDEDWRTECAARALFAVPRYRPITEAADVHCPVFVAQATEDAILPAEPVDELVDAVDDVERVRLEMAHFDAYIGDDFERLVDRECRFLEEHLSPAPGVRETAEAVASRY